MGGEAFADRMRWIVEKRENEVARRKDDRGRWMRRNKRRGDNQPGQTREVNGKWTPRMAVGRQERQRRTVMILLPSERWNVCLTRFALLDFML
jgi:hypothetical protein